MVRSKRGEKCVSDVMLEIKTLGDHGIVITIPIEMMIFRRRIYVGREKHCTTDTHLNTSVSHDDVVEIVI